MALNFNKNRNFLFITGFFLLNFIIKLIYITKNQLDIDEPFTIYWAQAGLNELFGLFKDENNPPLFFLLMHFWIKIFGTSLMSVRFLPVLFGSLSVIFVYCIGSRFFNKYVAIIASFLYSFSNLATYHSHDVRVYSLFILLSTMSIYFLLRLNENPEKRTNLFWWIIINILLSYSHFYGFILLFFEFGFIMLNKSFRQKLWKAACIMSISIILAYLPYIKLIVARFLSAKNGTWVSKPDFQAPYFRIVEFSNEPLIASLFLLLIIFFIAFIIHSKSKIKNTEWAIFLWFLAPFLFMYIISFRIPMFISKYMVFILPGYYLSISIILFRVIEKFKKVQLLLGILTVVLMGVTSNPASGNNRQPKETVEYVKNIKSDSTIVFLCPPWLDINIAYYYNRKIFNDFGNVSNRLGNEQIYAVYNSKDMKSEQLQNASSVLFIDGWYQVTDPEGTILKKLRSNFLSEEKTEFRGYSIYKFSERK